MRILDLETTGVRGLRDASYRLDPERGGRGHATLVTGPPQCGLTTFLDAIALTAARLAVGGARPDTADVLRAGGAAAMIRTTWWLDPDERAFGGLAEETTQAEVVFQQGGLGRADADPALLGLMSRYDHTPGLSKVVLLPARRVADGGVPMLSDFASEQKFKHLSPDVGKFAGLSAALVKHASGFGERARFEGVQRLLAELGGSVRLEGVGAAGHLDFTLASGARVPLHRLSLGERSAFVLAATVVLMGLERSVVLLDTPEMGLAPGVAARWLDVLRGATPEAQWIVASRDHAVVASVPPAARIALGPTATGAP
jgi:hypothetical protein